MNLQDLPKDALIEITRKLHGSVGDTGRNNKQHYVDLLTSQYHDEALLLASQEQSTTMVDDIARIGDEAQAAVMLRDALRMLTPQQSVKRGDVENIVREFVNDAELTSRDQMQIAIREAVAVAIENTPAKIKRIVISPKGEREVPAIAHPLFEDVLSLAGLRHNILLVGPAGVGKTTIGSQVADALSLPFGAISCSAGMSESAFIGHLLPIAEGGKFVYVPSLFVELYENGGVFLIDEIDALDGNTAVVINSALANGGFYITIRHEQRYVKRHPDFVCIAAANTFGHGGDMVYAARERLDGATLDRFRSATLYMGYDKDMEAALVDADVLAWGLEIRGKIESLKLRRVMSTRVMIQFSEQKANLDWGVDKWERSYFADWTKDEMRKIGRAV